MCARHVYANLRKTYKGMQFRKLFWAITKSTTQVGFEKLMKDLDSCAWDFLLKKTLNSGVDAFLVVLLNVTR